MASADFSLRHPVASPFQAQGEISLSKTDDLHRTTAGCTPRLFDRESFAVSCQLALISSASNPFSVRQLAVSVHASFRPLLAESPLRFPSVPTVRSRKDFHLQVISHVRHTRKNAPVNQRRSAFPHEERSGSPSKTRTCDNPVNSRTLYQLSYRGTVVVRAE